SCDGEPVAVATYSYSYSYRTRGPLFYRRHALRGVMATCLREDANRAFDPRSIQFFRCRRHRYELRLCKRFPWAVKFAELSTRPRSSNRSRLLPARQKSLIWHLDAHLDCVLATRISSLRNSSQSQM